jgi:hypothetical protein
VTLVTAALVALMPVVRLSSTRRNRDARPIRDVRPHGRRGRGILIVAEVALAVVLLVSSAC